MIFKTSAETKAFRATAARSASVAHLRFCFSRPRYLRNLFASPVATTVITAFMVEWVCLVLRSIEVGNMIQTTQLRNGRIYDKREMSRLACMVSHMDAGHVTPASLANMEPDGRKRLATMFRERAMEAFYCDLGASAIESGFLAFDLRPQISERVFRIDPDTFWLTRGLDSIRPSFRVLDRGDPARSTNVGDRIPDTRLFLYVMSFLSQADLSPVLATSSYVAKSIMLSDLGGQRAITGLLESVLSDTSHFSRGFLLADQGPNLGNPRYTLAVDAQIALLQTSINQRAGPLWDGGALCETRLLSAAPWKSRIDDDPSAPEFHRAPLLGYRTREIGLQ